MRENAFQPCIRNSRRNHKRKWRDIFLVTTEYDVFSAILTSRICDSYGLTNENQLDRIGMNNIISTLKKSIPEDLKIFKLSGNVEIENLPELQADGRFWDNFSGSWKLFKVEEKCLLFYVKCSFRFYDILFDILHWLSLLLEVLGNMCISLSVCYVKSFEINFSFLFRPFFNMTRKSLQKFKNLENDKSF